MFISMYVYTYTNIDNILYIYVYVYIYIFMYAARASPHVADPYPIPLLVAGWLCSLSGLVTPGSFCVACFVCFVRYVRFAWLVSFFGLVGFAGFAVFACLLAGLLGRFVLLCLAPGASWFVLVAFWIHLACRWG